MIIGLILSIYSTSFELHNNVVLIDDIKYYKQRENTLDRLEEFVITRPLSITSFQFYEEDIEYPPPENIIACFRTIKYPKSHLWLYPGCQKTIQVQVLITNPPLAGFGDTMRTTFLIIVYTLAWLYLVTWIIITTISFIFGSKAFNYCFHSDWDLINIIHNSNKNN